MLKQFRRLNHSIGLVHCGCALSPAFRRRKRSRIDLTGRLRFAEINTNDLPAFIISNSRRSSSGVHLVPRCCTVITDLPLARFDGWEARTESLREKQARLKPG